MVGRTAASTLVRVWRTAFRPRWLALLGVVLVAATIMAQLGHWQFSRAVAEGEQAQLEGLAREPVDLTTLLTPQTLFPSDAVDRPVTVTGTWLADEQVLVAGVSADETDPDAPEGYWVVQALELSSGAVVPVVRGWRADAGTLDADLAGPTGTVTVTGVLTIADPPVERGPGETSGLPAGQLEGVDVVELGRLWSQPLYTGYVRASGDAVAEGLTAVSPLHAGSGVALRNISYALQWWLFAGFGLFLWWRLVRDDHLGRLPGGTPPPGAGPDGPDGPAPVDPAPGPVDRGTDDPAPAPAPAPDDATTGVPA